MICRYHAFLRTQTKARGHIYVPTTVTDILSNPEGIRIIYKNFPCTITLFSLLENASSQNTSTQIFITTYMMQLPENTSTDLMMLL